MTHLLRTPILIALLLALVACGKKDDPPRVAQPSEPTPEQSMSSTGLPPGIDWFEGDTAAAFAAAKASGQPLFLYWGAEWCPPCAQIKATIFSRPEFQERSRLFVPVYLDGDLPSAQKLGERFGVIGYPTMILFRPDGTEITRLPGGVDVERYTGILDIALEDARPVSDVLAAAIADPEALSDNDWRLLAYYSWSTDNGRVLPDDQRVTTFRALADSCPSRLRPDCARLFFEYLGAAAARAANDKASMLPEAEKKAATQTLLDLIDEPAVRSANIQNLLYGAEPVLEVLSAADSVRRAELVAGWRAALDALQASGQELELSAAERLNLLRARAVLVRLESPQGELPAALLDEARSTVAAIDAQTTDSYERQTAINAAANLYWEAGLDAEAETMLRAELEKSKSPYYFMLSLAEFAQRAGQQERAVEWLAMAYADAEGPATRFQWGYNYLMGLIEMTPDDTARIQATALQVLNELDTSPDALYQRTRMRLDKLNEKLLEWGQEGERREVIMALRAQVDRICAEMPEGDESRARCETFLTQDVPVTSGA